MTDTSPPSTSKPSLRGVVALLALWAVISGAALLAPGCYGRNCEGGVDTIGTQAGQGRMLDENTWESGPQNGKWLWFPRQKYYIFDIRTLGGRTPQLVIPYVSAQEEPNQLGGNFTIGAGNLALMSMATPNRIDVRNDTCSDYFLRVVVVAEPAPPSAARPDAAASTPLDAGAEGDDVSDDAGDTDAGADENP